MDKLSPLELAQNQGYIIGSSSAIESLQHPFYKWCGENLKPYITISTRTNNSHFSVDTPNTKLRLNDNGVRAMRSIMEQYIETTGTFSIENSSIFHDNVPIKVAEKLAMKTVEIFKNKDNLE